MVMQPPIGSAAADLPGRLETMDAVDAPMQGRLLVATPALGDPNFDRTVVYLLEHRDDGAIGVVINRPSDDALTEPLDRWTDLLATPSSLFVGGPVEPDALIALSVTTDTVTEPSDEVSPVAGRVVSTDLTTDPAFVAGIIEGVRVFRGYAGWGAGQIEAEIASGAWLTVDAEPDDLLSSEPDNLWRAVLRRQGGRIAWLATAPDDLSTN